MASRTPRPALLLTLGLFVTWLALVSGQHCFPPFKNFLWEHWDFPKTPAKNPDHYCNMMMSYRKLYGKPKNTFIHEPVDYIKYVCQGGGKPIGGNWFESIGFYHTTQCILKYPHRHYIGIKKFKKIILLCKFGFPVEINECVRDSPWGWKADGEHFESLKSWSVPSDLYTAPDSSSASEHYSDGSDVSSSPPSATPSDHCTI